ncbi:hypothetical protein [Streptomyces alboflavus]|uniref:hypothetical protein n=1 Tax=Streptomyces alboflavus TaxID=67267 RepID=UPI000B06E5A8|nr:hypothetical protein [Streptomyces alboflavus]
MAKEQQDPKQDEQSKQKAQEGKQEKAPKPKSRSAVGIDSLGDSYTSGEGGRWKGNADR